MLDELRLWLAGSCMQKTVQYLVDPVLLLPNLALRSSLSFLTVASFRFWTLAIHSLMLHDHLRSSRDMRVDEWGFTVSRSAAGDLLNRVVWLQADGCSLLAA